VEGDVNPFRDIKVIVDELIKKDLEKFTQRFDRLLIRRNKPFQGLENKKEIEETLSIVHKAKEWLLMQRELRHCKWTDREIAYLSTLQTWTSKPVVFLLNMSSDDYKDISKRETLRDKVLNYAKSIALDAKVVPFSVSLEEQERQLKLDKIKADEAIKLQKKFAHLAVHESNGNNSKINSKIHAITNPNTGCVNDNSSRGTDDYTILNNQGDDNGNDNNNDSNNNINDNDDNHDDGDDGDDGGDGGDGGDGDDDGEYNSGSPIYKSNDMYTNENESKDSTQFSFSSKIQSVDADDDDQSKSSASNVPSVVTRLDESLSSTCLREMITQGYTAAHLIHFFTCDRHMVRGWMVKEHTKASKASCKLHWENERYFLSCEVCKYEDFLQFKDWNGAKDKGKVRTQGKDYVVQDGDIIKFKIMAKPNKNKIVSGGNNSNSNSNGKNYNA
jgi:ribosome-binding ATPase YchF (GTP1/OBG family)